MDDIFQIQSPTLMALIFLALGAFVLAIPGGILLARLRRQIDQTERARSEIAAALEKQREIIAQSPDGLFSWDIETATPKCSRQLAVLLNLKAGTQSTFDDVLGSLHAENADTADALANDVGTLRKDGSSFERLIHQHHRTLLIIGVRAGTADDVAVADLVWFRDVSAAAGTTPPQHADAEREQLLSLLDSLPFPVWLRDAKLNIAFTNPAATLMADDIVDTHLARQALDRKQTCIERQLFTFNDAPRLMDIAETPMTAWTGTIGYAIDRTQAERTEGELAHLVAAQDSVLENLSTAIALFGTDTRLTYSNSAYATLWGFEPGWLAIKPSLAEILDRQRDRRRLPEYADFGKFRDQQVALFGSITGPVETMLHLPDGTTLRAIVAPFDDAGGLIFTFEDVTGRLELERRHNALIAVQGETLDNLFEGVCVFGGDGRIKLYNPSFASLWNLSNKDLADDPHVTEFVEMTHPLIAGDNDWQTHKEKILSRAPDHKPGTGQLIRTNGTVLDYAKVPLPDGAMLISYLDVTDSTRVELTLRERAEALQEADRLKSEFIADVSYEIRSPLTSIIGFSELLAGGTFGTLNRRQTEYCNGIIKASLGMRNIINDILDLATINAGKMTLALDTVDLHGLLASSLGLMKERARRGNITLNLDCPPDIGWIVADETRLKQALFNMIGNAINLTPAQGKITIRGYRTPEEVVMEVVDSGPVVANSDRQLTFDSLVSDDPDAPKKPPNSGLGLTLVRRFVELHGGYVRIKSTKGKGNTVSCRLPVDSGKN